MLIRAAIIVAAATTALNATAQEVKLIGSGASFPFPIYSAWFKDFSKQNKGVTVDYQAKGSGAGIQDFTNRTVDFAGSDAAMTDEEIAKVADGVVLLPVTAGEIVLAYNLTGNPKDLRLPRDVYPDIFLGKVTKWNDPRIVAANPDLKLPDLPITVVRRSDSSGTTFVFTKHLAAINEVFAKEVGTGTTVQWPKSEKIVAAPKNDGVTATIKQTPGAIGYIEYGYAKLTKADFALLQNKAGQFILGGHQVGPGDIGDRDSRFPPAGMDRRPGGPRCLSDRHLHLAPRVQETGCQEGGMDAQAGRILCDHGPIDIRQYGLHPIAGEHHR
jgi:phosphate transport system substrate-binding protein